MAASHRMECSFCLSTGAELVDPRKLPCGDIGCSSCVTRLMEENDGELTCCRCNVLHGQIDFDSLKKIDLGYGVITLACDGCNCHMTTVKYCMTCDRKYCGIHLQTHNSLKGPNHEMVTVTEYKRSHDRYHKVPCEHHVQEVVTEACKICDRLVCKRCDKTAGCKDFQHEFKPLGEVVEKITSTLKELIKLSNARRLEHLSREKEVWKKLDVVNEECKKWTREIERVRDQQIKQINEESEKVKHKIEKYLKEAIEKVEKFGVEMLVAKDSLDLSSGKVSQLVEKGHMTEKIKLKDELTEEITRNVNVEVDSCEPTKNVSLIVKEKPTKFNVDFVDLPSSLTLFSKQDTSGYCYSANHKANGDVLVGCIGGLYLFSNNREMTKCHLPYKQVFTAVEHGHSVYVIHRVGNICKVDICLPNLEYAQTLFEFEAPSKYAPSMAVFNRQVVVYRPDDTNQLIIYDIVSREKAIIPVTSTHHPFILSSGELLAVGNHQLIKYHLDNCKLTTIWTTEVKNVCRVCADLNGVLFASTWNNQQSVYIISPAGELLREIGNDQLPAKLTGQISIQGDELVVPGWYDEKLYVFKMNY